MAAVEPSINDLKAVARKVIKLVAPVAAADPMIRWASPAFRGEGGELVMALTVS